VKNFRTITMRYFEGKSPEPQEMHVANRNGRTVSHEIARHRCLPKDPSVWALSDNNGWSVAHEAARYGNLPSDFSCWDIRNHDGRTVAHEAAARGDLPKGFKDFWMCDCKGWMVAHECASSGKLPKGFDSWEAFTEMYPINYTGIAVSEVLNMPSTITPWDFVHSGELTLEPSMDYSGEDLFIGLSKYLNAYGIASISLVNTAPDRQEPNKCFVFQPWTRKGNNMALFCEVVVDSFDGGVSCFHLDDNGRGFVSEDGDWGIIVPFQTAALVFENMVELMSRFYLRYSVCRLGLFRKPLLRLEGEMPTSRYNNHERAGGLPLPPLTKRTKL